MTQEELNQVLELHRKWCYGEPDGQKANLRGAKLNYLNLSGALLYEADLSEAFLYGADLSNAILGGVDLREANLSRAKLTNAYLFNADLSGVSLIHADLCRTNLFRADLSSSNLRGAYLYHAILCGTDLSRANLSEAALQGADISETYLDRSQEFRKGIILTENLIGYKKCEDDVIVTLEIPKGAIVFCINGSKCRTNTAKCIDISNNKEIAYSNYEPTFRYEIGKTYIVNNFNLAYNIECGTGIHFFKTRKEAEEYDDLL